MAPTPKPERNNPPSPASDSLLTSRDNRWLKQFRIALRGGLQTDTGSVGVEGLRLVQDARSKPSSSANPANATAKN